MRGGVQGKRGHGGTETQTLLRRFPKDPPPPGPLSALPLTHRPVRPVLAKPPTTPQPSPSCSAATPSGRAGGTTTTSTTTSRRAAGGGRCGCRTSGPVITTPTVRGPTSTSRSWRRTVRSTLFSPRGLPLRLSSTVHSGSRSGEHATGAGTGSGPSTVPRMRRCPSTRVAPTYPRPTPLTGTSRPGHRGPSRQGGRRRGRRGGGRHGVHQSGPGRGDAGSVRQVSRSVSSRRVAAPHSPPSMELT